MNAVALEPEEKAAGRLFRQQCQTDLDRYRERFPPDFDVPVVIAIYRHLCPGRGGASVALEAREVYVHSPEIIVLSTEHGIVRARVYDVSIDVGDFDTWLVPAGRFGFIYRTGRCVACNQRGTSRIGQIVDAWRRPPIVDGHR